MTALGEHGPVVVVGAGPAGSLLSILLAQRGHDVALYESRPDLRTHDISAGRSINMALATRGIVALQRAGVMDAVDEITIPMRGRMVHDLDGTQTLQPYGIKESDVIQSVSRSDLNAILVDAAEATGRVKVHFEQRCLGVDFDRDTAAFTDASGATHDVPFGALFGTDGANSPVRASILAINGGDLSEDELGHGYKELVLPPGPDGSFQLDPNALHIWPRGELMLIALANPGGDFTVTLFMPMKGVGDTFADLHSADHVLVFFEREFPDFAPLLPDLAQEYLDAPTGNLATIRCRGWSFSDRAVVLGDAAHGIVPFHGQGMNAAMESCLILDRYLQATPDDVAAAFGAFETERKPDTDAIADMALSNYLEMRAGVVDPDYVLRRKVALEMERRWPDQFAARYGMVMFHTMPYSMAMVRAERQGELLVELTAGIDDPADVDWSRAEMLAATLDPLPPLEAEAT